MANEIFRNRAITLINKALMQFHEATLIDHPGQKGALRELSAKSVFEPFLPEDYRIKESGKIIDCWGGQSSEIDLVIYSRKKLPPVMIEERELCFPAESVFYAIEVKSKLTATEIRSAHLKAKDLTNNIRYLPGLHTSDDQPIQHTVTKIIPALFGFSSDLINGGKSELERYKEIIDPGDAAYLCVICVVGRGYWYQNNNRWLFVPATVNHDEVIGFLAGVTNTLHLVDETRHFPRLGNYLVSETPSTLIL